jgi:hypothetical protein
MEEMGKLVESKELIAGFAILQAKSKEAALEAAKRFHQWLVTVRASFAIS